MISERLGFTLTFLPCLQDWERKHKQVVAIYRSHLLAAVQVSWIDRWMTSHQPLMHRCHYIGQLRKKLFPRPGVSNSIGGGANKIKD